MAVKHYSQIVDKEGNLKSLKCPECKSNAMYFNFHRTLICRNCGYTPSCPTCKRYYHSNDAFKNDKDTIHMRRPEGNPDIKSRLQEIIGQLSRIISHANGAYNPMDGKELIHDLDRYLKGVNDHFKLGNSRYKEKDVDPELLIKSRKAKIKKLKRDLEYHESWHKDRIEDLEDEIKKLKKKEK